MVIVMPEKVDGLDQIVKYLSRWDGFVYFIFETVLKVSTRKSRVRFSLDKHYWRIIGSYLVEWT